MRSESVKPISELTSKPPFGLDVADDPADVSVSPLRVDVVLPEKNENTVLKFVLVIVKLHKR